MWIQFVLATPVVLYCGFPFFERGWASVKNKSPNMFTLIAVGTGAAYLYSIVALIFPDLFPVSMRDTHTNLIAVYFESAAVIITLVLLGQVLELRARSQTSSAIKELLGLAPKTARVVFDDGSEEEIALEDVQIGATLRVKANEKIPTDGVIVEGETLVDESMVTGEPVPVEKTSGTKIIGGTINGNRTFLMKAEKVGGETLLAQIVQMVGEAQRSRAPIQRLADVVSAYFVPRCDCLRDCRVHCLDDSGQFHVGNRRGGFGFNYRLSVRSRFGNADVNYGRHGTRREKRRFSQKSRSVGDFGKGQHDCR